jgi:hypothetical protein
MPVPSSLLPSIYHWSIWASTFIVISNYATKTAVNRLLAPSTLSDSLSLRPSPLPLSYWWLDSFVDGKVFNANWFKKVAICLLQCLSRVYLIYPFKWIFCSVFACCNDMCASCSILTKVATITISSLKVYNVLPS